MKRALWPLSIAAGCTALILTGFGTPAWAQVGAGEFTFTWAQVAILVALGCAWGDMRANVASIKERLNTIEGRRK